MLFQRRVLSKGIEIEGRCRRFDRLEGILWHLSTAVLSLEQAAFLLKLGLATSLRVLLVLIH